MNKGKVDVVSKTGHEKKESSPFAEHTQWLIKMSIRPLADQAVIVGFYYFWRHRNETFRQYYKRFQPEDRMVLKQRAWICQQYSKQYLGVKLEVWYMHFIISMDFTVPNEPLVELQQSQLRPMLQRVYLTHDPEFIEPTFPQNDHKKEQSKGRKNGFFNFLKNIFSFSHKNEEKDEVREGQIQECISLKPKSP